MPDRFSTLRSFAIRQYWCRFVRLPVFLICGLLVAAETVWAQSGASSGSPSQQDNSCSGDNGGLTLSPGFCATVFADNLGHVRHMAVAPNGVLYVNTWSGRYFHNDTPPAGGFLVALKDTNGDGNADVIERFGDGVAQGSAGGTGIAFYNGAVYAEQNDKIIRYAMPGGFDRAARHAGGRRLGAAAHRRSPDASLRHRRAGPDLRRPRLGDQFLPVREPHAEFARARPLHRARDPRRHLAL